MKRAEIRKYKDELYEKINRNKHNISVHEKKIKNIEYSKFDNKIINIIQLSIIPFYSLSLGGCFLSNNLVFKELISKVPPLIISPIIIGISLSVGTITNKIINKNNKDIDYKNEEDKINEEIQEKIELEKKLCHNKIMDKMIYQLNIKEEFLYYFTRQYKINENNLLNTKKAIEQKVNILNESLSNNYHQLDDIITHNALYEYFNKIKSKSQIISGAISYFLVGGLAILAMFEIPLVMMKDIISYNSSAEVLVSIVGSYLVGAIGVSSYYFKKVKAQYKIYNSYKNNNLIEIGILDQKELLEELVNDICKNEIILKELQSTLKIKEQEENMLVMNEIRQDILTQEKDWTLIRRKKYPIKSN